jgi:hypothetical protein
VLKICPSCHRTFSGGRLCPGCGDPVLLLDVADPSTRPHLRQAELQHTINTYYGARTAMLLLFGGMLFGGALALAVARRGFVAPVGQRWAWLAAAAACLLGLPTAAVYVGGRIVHLFSSVCRGRTPTLDDLRYQLRRQRKPADPGT